MVTYKSHTSHMHRVKECLKSHDNHVTEVDTYLEDLEASDVEDSDEGGLGAERSVQRFVDSENDPLEQSLVECLGQGLTGELSLRGGGGGGRGEDEQVTR